MIFLKTERLILRNVEEQDIPTIFDYRNNEACARYQRGQVKQLEEIEDLVKNHRQDQISTEANFLLAVALRETNELIGEILVMPNDGCISLGYTVSYRHHRRGYAFEALSALMELLHSRYPDWEFICFTEPENTASMALLLKLGYEDLGYVEQVRSQMFGKWVKEEN